MDDDPRRYRPPARFLSRDDLLRLYTEVAANEQDARQRGMAKTRLEALRKTAVDTTQDGFTLRRSESGL